MIPWSEAALVRITAAEELEIASRRADGSLRGWVPVWVVTADEQVYVRTWYRRQTGWFGHVLRTPEARIRVPGLEADVIVEDVGDADTGLRARVDAAYEAKYGRHGRGSVERMVAGAAAAATLRLVRA